MSITIAISDHVSVTRHGGIMLSEFDVGFVEKAKYRDAFIELFAMELGIKPDSLAEDLERALWVQGHEITQDCWCGGCGPLAGELGAITYERFVEIADKQERAFATVTAKMAHTAIRRDEFNKVRSDRVLALIDMGSTYQCNHPGCQVRTNLTIDHVVALSRGGTDDLGNLQFMCGPHNSQKGDR